MKTVAEANESGCIDHVAANAARIVIAHLSLWPLYDSRFTPFVKTLEDRMVIQYGTGPDRWHGTDFALNIIGDICYLLSIRIDEEHRGKGLGRQLYGVVENIARDLGCREVRMMPSGMTGTKESRRDYVKRLGYQDREPCGEVFKSVVKPLEVDRG